VNIRESRLSDLEAINTLHRESFGEPEGESIGNLACDILQDVTAQPLLSLVLEEQNQIIGHIIFSPLTLEGTEDISAYILCPLAISKAHQKLGLGTQLIQNGLHKITALGVELVFVLGDPNYYNRTGFKAGHSVSAPYPLEYPEAWMVQELKPGSLPQKQAVAKCCTSLMVPEHW